MILRYVNHERMLPYLQCGWHILVPPEWDYHAQWGMTLAWLCDCATPEPFRKTEHDALVTDDRNDGRSPLVKQI